MIESCVRPDRNDVIGKKAMRLIGEINPRLLSLPQYTQALQRNIYESRREVPFDLDGENGTTRYEIVTEFKNKQSSPEQLPSRLIIAKHTLVPRGPSFQKDPVATLQLVAERGLEGEFPVYRHGYIAIIVGKVTTPIERDDQMPLIYECFGEFLP